MPPFHPDHDCQFDPPTSNPVLANAMAESTLRTILAVPWERAYRAGCNNYGELATALSAISDALRMAGFPAPFTMLLMVRPYYSGPVGGPLTDQYPSHNINVRDNVPDMDVAIMDVNDYLTFARTRGNDTSPQYVRVVQEPGPWNDTFLSNGYQSLVWSLFVINAVIIAYGAYTLAYTLVTQTFAMDIRNAVFILGILSVASNSVAIPLRNASYLRMTMEQISSLLSSVAFYMLLYLWSSLLSQIKHDRTMLPFRCFLGFGALVAVWTLCIGLSWLNTWNSAPIAPLIKMTRYVTPITQTTVAALFCIVGYRFRMRRNQCRMSRETQHALTKLAWLSVMGFATFLLQAVANVMVSHYALLTNVTAVAIMYVFITLSFTIRGMAIVMVLGVRVPKHLGGSGGTSGIISSTGDARTSLARGAESMRTGSDTADSKAHLVRS
ncbi:hypothetical protein THASP1DRAFT_28812 [Thamnocephalis sphaerospora]|uniref:Uncharacterized protein n=1 Tax=Thamnocephalis sphaerospora TaxID=78915 RepID=A0A4P9XTB9_9FUNG|nr:hypothetical protein THASP1DRAFT_28812 [Thamnocephalis sphaerospora]|eukprot:RKP09386.1 hypothetical protein THASP1DRAFT_28812 [Thamnocephalis sphaerospora]